MIAVLSCLFHEQVTFGHLSAMKHELNLINKLQIYMSWTSVLNALTNSKSS